MYQPKTGNKCGCKRGIERDNCPACEGTGMQIDFKAVREMPLISEVLRFDDSQLVNFVNSKQAVDFFKLLKWNRGRVYSRHSYNYCITTLRQVLNRILELREEKAVRERKDHELHIKEII
jgi:hypothetical protein